MKDKINALYDLALDLNYTSLGAMAMSKLKDETLKNNIIEKFPWAKAIIISPWHYNYYHFSKDLRSVFDKTEIFQGRFIDGTQENLAGLALEAFMVTCGFKSKALEPVDPRALENLAATLGLGIIRKILSFIQKRGLIVICMHGLLTRTIILTMRYKPKPVQTIVAGVSGSVPSRL